MAYIPKIFKKEITIKIESHTEDNVNEAIQRIKKIIIRTKLRHNSFDQLLRKQNGFGNSD